MYSRNRFINDLQSQDLLNDRGQGVSEDDERTIADLLIDQIEFCNVLILNKTDLVTICLPIVSIQ